MRYTPFEVELPDVTDSHLAALCDVAEGWYVEYKSETPKPSDLAKSLSSFANRYGGWLFLGVKEDPTDNTADSFPGIASTDVTAALEQLRNAAKDLLHPTVSFSTQGLSGPLPAISLAEERAVVIVRVPEGGSPPYIHNDGRVYIRTGDSSSPVPARDRTTLELLHRKGEERVSLLASLASRTPEVSKAEEDVSYLHLFICSDPFEVLEHWYSGSYSDFTALMTSQPLPFDNIYASQDGFVARQARGNDRYKRVFTWEFSRRCTSFISIPLNTLRVPPLLHINADADIGEWSHYDEGKAFLASLRDDSLKLSRVIDLNLALPLIGAVLARHRTVAGSVGIKGPFYVKATIENVWRTIPFIDTAEYMANVGRFDVPVVQDSDLAAPPGGWPEGFIALPELEEVPSEEDPGTYARAIPIWLAVMQALGIPGQILAESAGNKLVEVALREAGRHRERWSQSAGTPPEPRQP